MFCARCRHLVSVGLVCACMAQGVEAPPAAVIGTIVGPVLTVASTSSTSADSVADTVTGRVYKISAVAERSPMVVMPSTTAMAPSTVTLASTSPFPSATVPPFSTVPCTGSYD
jgi:hypothetical protein